MAPARHALSPRWAGCAARARSHLDLLPIVRRVFRHRMDDARLQTAERTLLGRSAAMTSTAVEIPGRYLGFLRGWNPAASTRAVVRHNHEDVRSLARILALLDAGLARPSGASVRADAGIWLVWRARSAGSVGTAKPWNASTRPSPASGVQRRCQSHSPHRAGPGRCRRAGSATRLDVPWWSPGFAPDFGGRPRSRETVFGPSDRREAFVVDRGTRSGSPWTGPTTCVGSAGCTILEAWDALACGPGRSAIVAAVEAAKLREHRAP